MYPKPQVAKEYYFKGYDDKARWVTYWHQIDEVLKSGCKEVLEVGIGNGTVCDYLKRMGLKVTTVDIDPALNPDYVGSVTELTNIFATNSFDCILCAEVLEHIPFDLFEKALDELYAASRDYVIISLPYSGIGASISLRWPINRHRAFVLKIPLPRRHRFDGQHYWEIGKIGYSLRKVMRLLEKRFIIAKRFIPPEKTFHIFFVLRRQAQ